ncbi:hypothetical protein VCHC46A1_0091, partial [Vibrio cholerae HC-46A1]
DVTLSAFIGYQAFGLDHLFDSGNDAGAIGPAIYLPLFTGGRLEGQLTSAEARYQVVILAGKRVRNVDRLLIQYGHFGTTLWSIFSLHVAAVEVAKKPNCRNNQ